MNEQLNILKEQCIEIDLNTKKLLPKINESLLIIKNFNNNKKTLNENILSLKKEIEKNKIL